MKSTVLLDEAIAIQLQRAAEHGYGEEGERTAAHVARIFNAITGRNLKERDIWIVMMALKLARNEAAPGREDTLIDLASYSSLLGECDIAAELKRLEDAEKDNQENIDRAQLQSLGDKLVADLAAKLVKPDAWLDWKGGNDPVEHWVKVDVKFRDGTMNENVSAGGIRWGNDGYRDDVIAFRVCPPVPKPLTAAAYQAQQDEGWIEWGGIFAEGPATMADKVYVKFSNGMVSEVPENKSNWHWLSNGEVSDIVAWKPAK
ncbi:hypothetical protein MED16_gp53 [Pantoea phage vB_PagS_MED16]|nr:hypothetical protein MED16_gp53 [Pantoea phage vB_PagS_MED16]